MITTNNHLLDTSKLKKVYFSGIKGVGMTALALYVQDIGIEVGGCDVAESFVTQEVLTKRNIPIDTGFSSTLIKKNVDLLIYSAARKDNPQIDYAKSSGTPYVSYAQAVGLFTKKKKVVAICGVGGKTTTTAMLALILEKNNKIPSYINGVGNIPNLGVPGKWTKGEFAVVEADEYASLPGVDNTPKFQYLSPQIIIATNLVYDHPDVYKSPTETINAFKTFFKKLPKSGYLIINRDDEKLTDIVNQLLSQDDHPTIISYGEHPKSHWRVKNITIKNQRTTFQLKTDTNIFTLSLKIPGVHNAKNAVAAMIAAQVCGVNPQQSIQAIEQFTGTKRRFEFLGKIGYLEVWDDYAHHPIQIEQTLKAARSWFSPKSFTVIFQPHTYSRTKSLFTDFSQAFSSADRVIITEIFSSARESKDPEISGEKLAAEIAKHHPAALYCPKSAVLEYVRKNSISGVIMTLGAGDIYKLGTEIITHG